MATSGQMNLSALGFRQLNSHHKYNLSYSSSNNLKTSVKDLLNMKGELSSAHFTILTYFNKIYH